MNIVFLLSLYRLGFQGAATHLVPNPFDPRTSGPPLPVPLDKRSPLWHFRLWSFQGRDTKLKRFLAKNQLYSNEIIKF